MVMEVKFMSREGPAWLMPLLQCEEFFTHCKFHSAGKNERNQFCFDCPEAGALCLEDLARLHGGHASIQIRRASHRDVVRVADIQRTVDVTNVQLYTINSAKIVFLVSRPQEKVAKGAAHSCEICLRSIADPVRFCSILCKLVGIQEDPQDFTLTLTVFAKSGPGFFSKGAAVSAAPSPATSAHSHGSGITDFMPETPTKTSKRRVRDASFSVSKKKSKLALPAVSMILPLASSVMSSIVPNTPAYESHLRVHRRKQSQPQQAPMF